MIAYNDPEKFTKMNIMNSYNLNRELVDYLVLVYPVEGNIWDTYEEVKGFFGSLNLSSLKYGSVIRCLTDILGI